MLKLKLSYINNDYALPAQLNFQDPGTNTFESIIDLNDRILFYLIIILVVVFWFFISSLINSKYLTFSHGNLLELIWTLTPAIILWLIGIPSIKILYMIDEIIESEVTVKAIGNQWYWNYELTDKESV